MVWTEFSVHVIDFEGGPRTGVVEYGVVTLRRGAIERLDTRLCRPRGRVPVEEREVHGLAEGDLAGAAPFVDEWERFAGWRARGPLAAHFSATEHGLLRAVWPVPRLSPDFLEPGREVADWGPWIDSGRVAAEVLGPGVPLGLEQVVGRLGLVEALSVAAEEWCPPGRRGFHRAPFDALASALILLHLAREGDGTPWSLARLLVASTADVRRRDERMQTRLF